SKDGRFGFRRISFGRDEEATIILDKQPGDVFEVEWDMTPPPEGAVHVEVTEAQKESNALRTAEEDRVRNAYTATFYTEEKAAALAKELSIDVERTAKYLLKSRGNWAEIESFLRKTSAEKRLSALDLLDVISDKDLRDTPAATLADHLNHTRSIPEDLLPAISKRPPIDLKEALSEDNLFRRYVLNPRVANELLTPWRQFLVERMSPALVKEAQENPQTLVEWVKQHVSVRDSLNPQLIPVMPAGVWKARTADARSRRIFFVALARSMGIPARIERVAGKVQYYHRAWKDADFDASQPVVPQGILAASYTPTKTLDNPKYYTHFSIARIRPDAQLQTLNFERRGAMADMEQGDSWSGLLKRPVDEGHYLLVSGTRVANGKVLARIVSFSISANERTDVQLVMRENNEEIQVIGNLDAESVFRRADNGQETSILNAVGRGYFVVAILGVRQEPTNHALRDIAQLKNEFERWNRAMLFLFKSEQERQQFDRNEFGALPSTIIYGTDTSGRIANTIVEALKLSNADTLPIVVIADTFGRIVFVSQGYTIGLGEQMQKIIHKL
ncbi:MAG: transglutaminase-like domain-containing protein, partial [Tannerella sp.]|nr:transglutaminase-like domain-containing protein [Tannerella sp.]